VIDWLNGPAGVVASKRAAEPLVSVRVRLVGGTAASPIDSLST